MVCFVLLNYKSILKVLHDDQKLSKTQFILFWAEVFEQILRFIRVTAQTFQNCLQMLSVDKACLILVEHVENTFEILNFLPRILLENFVVFWEIDTCDVNIVCLVSFMHPFFNIVFAKLFVILINAIVIFDFLDLCVIVYVHYFKLHHWYLLYTFMFLLSNSSRGPKSLMNVLRSKLTQMHSLVAMMLAARMSLSSKDLSPK